MQKIHIAPAHFSKMSESSQQIFKLRVQKHSKEEIVFELGLNKLYVIKRK
jgi:hypothetical protein